MPKVYATPKRANQFVFREETKVVKALMVVGLVRSAISRTRAG
jgi:hypothetical protein